MAPSPLQLHGSQSMFANSGGRKQETSRISELRFIKKTRKPQKRGRRKAPPPS